MAGTFGNALVYMLLVENNVNLFTAENTDIHSLNKIPTYLSYKESMTGGGGGLVWSWYLMCAVTFPKKCRETAKTDRLNLFFFVWFIKQRWK